MFCPQCGATHGGETRFCKQCGANLLAIQQVMTSRPTEDKFNWSKTWVAEMFLSEAERKKRQHDLERERGITPEIKRYNEIKGGVIVGSIGLALMIFLSFFMEGVIRSGQVPEEARDIVSRVWIAGVIPLFIGIALIINGVFVSKKIVEAAKRNRSSSPDALPNEAEPRALRSADTNEFIPSSFSVTEGTTKHLSHSAPSRETPHDT